LLLDHVMVLLCPALIVVGDALTLTVGGEGVVTVRVAEPDTCPPPVFGTQTKV